MAQGEGEATILAGPAWWTCVEQCEPHMVGERSGSFLVRLNRGLGSFCGGAFSFVGLDIEFTGLRSNLARPQQIR